VVELLDAARRASARVVNSLMTATYWEMGRQMVEHEQTGNDARFTVRNFSSIFRPILRTLWLGIPRGQLERARQFYLTFDSANFRKAVAEISR